MLCQIVLSCIVMVLVMNINTVLSIVNGTRLPVLLLYAVLYILHTVCTAGAEYIVRRALPAIQKNRVNRLPDFSAVYRQIMTWCVVPGDKVQRYLCFVTDSKSFSEVVK
jgi:hypothetical protein